MANTSRDPDEHLPETEPQIAYERIAPTDTERALILRAQDHLLLLSDAFLSAWTSGAASDSASDQYERHARLRVFMTLYHELEQDVVGPDPFIALPRTISAWLYGGCLGAYRYYARRPDPSAPKRWDLPVARALSAFLDIFRDI